MDILTLSKIFSVRTGYIYQFIGNELDPSQDPSSELTQKISVLLGKNNFISSVTNINNTFFVYIDEVLPEDNTEFLLLGDVEQSLINFSLQQAEYLKSLNSTQEEQ